MIRAAIWLLFTGLILAGCSGPIETRIETHSAALLAERDSFSFGEQPGEQSETYVQAENLVREALIAKNITASDTGNILVELSLSSRPADVAISVGEKDKEHQLAGKKEKKFLQRCRDVEHRLSIGLLDQATGQLVYRGHAAEYHCKGTLSQSLPHLVEAALSDFGSPPTNVASKSVKKRTGIE